MYSSHSGFTTLIFWRYLISEDEKKHVFFAKQQNIFFLVLLQMNTHTKELLPSEEHVTETAAFAIFPNDQF